MPLSGARFKIAIVDELLEGVDLLYDATAEVGIQYLLSDLARSRKIAYVSVSTTPGAWGGRVARVLVGPSKACWMCLQIAEQNAVISRPSGDSRELVQPAGCAAPTFTGAGFDITEVSLAGVRLSVATLCAGSASAYPDFDWNVGTLFLRDAEGQVIAPRWETFNVEPQPSCQVCKNQ